MRFSEGKEFNEMLHIYIDLVNEVFNVDETNVDDIVKAYINKEKLAENYNNFVDELKENILEYNKTDNIIDYLNTCFEEFHKWNGFGLLITDQFIIRNQVEVGFFLKLKHAIEDYQKIINKWYELDFVISGIKKPLIERFEDIVIEIYMMNSDNEKILIGKESKPEKLINEGKLTIKEGYEFEELKIKCDKLPTTIDKIDFIREQLVDFKHWKLNCESNNLVEIMHLDSSYINFEKHCEAELESLKNKLVIEKERNLALITADSSDAVIPNYTWNASDTDLLELSTALFKTETIRRKDGTKMTQKELKKAFERMFGHEIKDAKSKLATAVVRKKSMTPFLDTLKAAFEAYSMERNENKPGQKKTGY